MTRRIDDPVWGIRKARGSLAEIYVRCKLSLFNQSPITNAQPWTRQKALPIKSTPSASVFLICSESCKTYSFRSALLIHSIFVLYGVSHTTGVRSHLLFTFILFNCTMDRLLADWYSVPIVLIIILCASVSTPSLAWGSVDSFGISELTSCKAICQRDYKSKRLEVSTSLLGAFPLSI